MFEDIRYYSRHNISEYLVLEDGFMLDIEICWPSNIDTSEGVWIDGEFIYKPW